MVTNFQRDQVTW